MQPTTFGCPSTVEVLSAFVKVERDHNQESMCPDGWRWVMKGEERQPGDRFAFSDAWVEIDNDFGRRHITSFELIRKVKV